MVPEKHTQEKALAWIAAGNRFATATVVDSTGSAPLGVGATMLIDQGGNIEGSVSGGCVEGAVVAECLEMLERGAASVLRSYGISDALAGDVGLMCGGTIQVLMVAVAPPTPALRAVYRAASEGRPAALATVMDGRHAGSQLAVVDGSPVGTLNEGHAVDHTVARDAAALAEQAVSVVRHYGHDGQTAGVERSVFVQAFVEPPRLIIFGATDFSASLARIAREVGYRVTICDARTAFLSSQRFTEAADVVNQWPDEYLRGTELRSRDVILVFSHDPKFDEPAIQAALKTEAGYIGALGSRRTHDERLARLRLAGIVEQDLNRLYGPCGLDIGAATPAETAISVLGEIIAQRTGRRGSPLREVSGPIRGRSHQLTIARG